jgi:YVTN family beta-propeller protein
MRRFITFGAALLALAPVGALPMTAILPDGRTISPSGFTIPVEGFASQLALSPDRLWLAVLTQDLGTVDVISTESADVERRLDLEGATRLLWTRNGLFVACGYTGKIAHFKYDAGKSSPLFTGPIFDRLSDLSLGSGTLVNGLAENTARHLLYVARTVDEEVAVVDESTGDVVREFSTHGQPFALALDGDALFATLYNSTRVAAWRNSDPQPKYISTGAHPTEILAAGGAVYVANADGHDVSVIDPITLELTRQIDLAQSADEPPGRTPAGMALSGNGRRLFVAESGMNDVAIVELRTGRVTERIPTGWYPMSLVFQPPTGYISRSSLWIANAKGYGSQPDAAGEWDGTYTGLVQRVVVGVKRSNEYAPPAPAPQPVAGIIPPIKHVVFIVKENKHFDEEFSDLPGVDGDQKLLLYGRKYTPNAHALAVRYTVFDRFFTNGEASIYGHSWTTQGWANDYQERNTRFGGIDYSSRVLPVMVPISIWPEPMQWSPAVTAADLDFDWYRNLSTLRYQPRVNTSAVFGPRGELINELERKHVSFRVYGEQMTLLPNGDVSPGLAAHADRHYPGEHIDFDVRDTTRAQLFLRDVQRHGLAAYTYMTLPTDHTAGTTPGFLTPASYIVNNDEALGMIIEGLSKRPEWSSTIVFVTMDDAQGTGDHYDSHRMPAIAIGPWIRRGFVDHTHYDQASILRTVEVLFHLDPLSTYDEAAPPILDDFASQPDSSAYRALPPNFPLIRNAGTPTRTSFVLDGPESVAFPMQEWLSIKGFRSLEEHLAYLRALGMPINVPDDDVASEP